MKGKIPPHAEDLEEVIIGACLIDSNAIAETVEIFRNEPVFYNAKYQEIYDAMLQMFNDSEPIDLLTVSNALRKRKKLEIIGGEYSLIQLTQKISSSANIERHCRIVQQYYVKRKSIQVGNDLAAKSYDDDTDIFELIDGSYKELDRVTEWLYTKKPSDLPDITAQIINSAEKQEAGIPSSLSAINDMTNGYQKSDLIILAARPGMGKTALMLNEVLAAATKGIPVGIFSCEMSSKQLVGRMLANYCEINAQRIGLNKMDEHHRAHLRAKAIEFNKLPIYIHDQAAISTLQMKIQASKWKREKGIQMIFVDYLQLMTAGGKTYNREQEISSISRNLKALAKELDVPVMALSQLSRSVETRGGNKRPLLSDLRESGAIEQDADMVAFIYRPEYYKIDQWDTDEAGPTENQAEINIAKFRNGNTGPVYVGTRLQYMQFRDLDQFPESPAPLKPATTTEAFYEPVYQSTEDDEDDLPF